MKKLILVLVIFAQGLVFASSGRDVLNHEINILFDGVKKEFVEQLKRRIRSEFTNKEVSGSLEVLHADLHYINILDFPLKVYEMREGRVVIGIPEENKWQFKIKAKLRYRGKLIKRATKVVKLKVKEVMFKYALNYKRDSNGALEVQSVELFDKKLRYSISASNILVNFLIKAFSPFYKNKLRKELYEVLEKGRAEIAKTLKYDKRFRQPMKESQKVAPKYSLSDLEATVLNIEDKIYKHNVPHGILLTTRHSEKDLSSWYDAYGPGSSMETKGEIIGYAHTADSAIFTGIYLGSQAFRFAVTRSIESYNGVLKGMEGVENLLGVNGFTGLLSRSAAPMGSLAAKSMASRKSREDWKVVNYKGQQWMNLHQTNGISRDQYSGVIFGLALVHDLVDDPDIRNKAKRFIRIMLDYLISVKWNISEDRKVTIEEKDTVFPTFWLGSNYQRLNYLAIGEHIFPGRYTKELNRLGSLSQVSYIFHSFTSADNVNKYYKFNLIHLHLFNYLRLEKNSKRRNDLMSSYKSIRYHIGNHDNSFFDIVQHSIDPTALSTEKKDRIVENLQRFLERGVRDVIINHIPREKFNIVDYPKHGGGNLPVSDTPIDIRYRHAGGSFMWQRDSYKVASFAEGNAFEENPGIDITLVYWMSKYYGL
jgi:hypothetical protein